MCFMLFQGHRGKNLHQKEKIPLEAAQKCEENRSRDQIKSAEVRREGVKYALYFTRLPLHPVAHISVANKQEISVHPVEALAPSPFLL